MESTVARMEVLNFQLAKLSADLEAIKLENNDLGNKVGTNCI